MANAPHPVSLGIKDVVRGVEVRPVRAAEQPLWDGLMQGHHYLGFQGMIGESLRYVAACRGRWLALLGWSSAAFKCGVRDHWIGWTPALRLQRLPLLANNCRFLILPGVRVPDLASRILALNLKRLSDDWQRSHGHPIWLAETFVDPDLYQGTCYRAAGWAFLGYTRGFAKNRDVYTHHGRIKSVFVRPLRRNALRKLADPGIEPPLKPRLTPMKLSENDAHLLHKALLTIPDSRMPRGIRHHRLAILSIAICAIICGAKSFDAIAQWAKACSQKMLKRLGCRKKPGTDLYEPPSEPAIRRFLQSLDGQAVDSAITGWSESIMGTGVAMAVDGKTLKGARSGDGRQMHLLAALLHQEATVVAQAQVPPTTNEITVVKQLLDPVPMEGAVVTLDALHTQHETARYLVEEKKADYLLTVKDNQPTLKTDIEDLRLTDSPPPHQTTDKGHGRIEVRSVWTSEELNDYLEFPYLQQVFCIRREVMHLGKNKDTSETVYGVTSLFPAQASPQRILALNRGQWSIENRLHWVRDVTFDEDRSQIRTGTGPRVMASLRNLVISILRRCGATNIAKTLRWFAFKTHLALRLIGL